MSRVWESMGHHRGFTCLVEEFCCFQNLSDIASTSASCDGRTLHRNEMMTTPLAILGCVSLQGSGSAWLMLGVALIGLKVLGGLAILCGVGLLGKLLNRF